MDLDDLFPNSLSNKIKIVKQITNLTPDQKTALDVVMDYAEQFQKLQVPVYIEIEKHAYSEYFYVNVCRGEHKEMVCITRVQGQADYTCALWKHILLGHSKPNKEKYDTDPTQVCTECGEKFTTYSDNKKCACVPF